MRGHIRKRGSKWAVVVDVGRDEDGKRRRKWHSGFDRRKDGERALAEILGQLDSGAYVEPAKITRRSRRPNSVYFIQERDGGPIKVGRGDPMQRLAELQTGNPRELVVLASLRVLHAGGAVRLEGALHERLWRHHVRGEWFEPAPELTAALPAVRAAEFVETSADGLALFRLPDSRQERFFAKVRTRLKEAA